VKEQFLRGQ